MYFKVFLCVISASYQLSLSRVILRNKHQKLQIITDIMPSFTTTDCNYAIVFGQTFPQDLCRSMNSDGVKSAKVVCTSTSAAVYKMYTDSACTTEKSTATPAQLGDQFKESEIVCDQSEACVENSSTRTSGLIAALTVAALIVSIMI